MGPIASTVIGLGLVATVRFSDKFMPPYRADAAIPGERNLSDAQVPQAPVHSYIPRMARRDRGRPRRSRTAITVSNATRGVIKIVGDEQLGDGRVLKIQAETWLAEEGHPSLGRHPNISRPAGPYKGQKEEHTWWIKREFAPGVE